MNYKLNSQVSFIESAESYISTLKLSLIYLLTMSQCGGGLECVWF